LLIYQSEFVCWLCRSCWKSLKASLLDVGKELSVACFSTQMIVPSLTALRLKLLPSSINSTSTNLFWRWENCTVISQL